MIVKTQKRFAAHVYTVYDSLSVIVIRTQYLKAALHYEKLIKEGFTAESLLQRDRLAGRCYPRTSKLAGPAAK